MPKFWTCWPSWPRASARPSHRRLVDGCWCLRLRNQIPAGSFHDFWICGFFFGVKVERMIYTIFYTYFSEVKPDWQIRKSGILEPQKGIYQRIDLRYIVTICNHPNLIIDGWPCSFLGEPPTDPQFSSSLSGADDANFGNYCKNYPLIDLRYPCPYVDIIGI